MVMISVLMENRQAKSDGEPVVDPVEQFNVIVTPKALSANQ
jgi:hypothetical protein